jgi:hypothetical protein
MSSQRRVSRTVAYAASVALALLLALPLAVGQTSPSSSTTVYATVVVARTGERSPELVAENSTLEITSYGANQMFNMVGVESRLFARLTRQGSLLPQQIHNPDGQHWV